MSAITPIITELPKSCMGWVTKSGETLFIHNEDVKNIAMKIVVEGSLRKCVAIVKEEDNSLKKADMLYSILKQEKDMKPELRNRYLKQISDLLSGKDVTMINCTDGGSEIKLVDDDTSDILVKHVK